MGPARPRRCPPLRRRLRTGACLVLLAIAEASCTGPGGRHRDGVLRHEIDTIGSVVHVRNEGAPPEWRLEPLATVGSQASLGAPRPDEFGRIVSVSPGPRGDLWVADALNFRVEAFDRDGALVRAVGREGQGPGEFLDLYSIAWAGEVLLALDFGNGRVAELSDTGAWLGARQAPGRISGPTSTLRLYPISDSTVDQWSLETVDGRVGGRWVEHGPRAVIASWPRLELAAPKPTGIQCRGNGAIGYWDLPFSGQLLQRPAGHGKTWVAWTERYRIALLDADGDTLRVVERTMEPVPVTDAEWDSAMAEIDRFRQQWKGARCSPTGIERPDAKPALRNFLLDTSGRLWVEAYTRSGTRWEIFGPDGSLEGALGGFKYVDAAPPSIRGDLIAWVDADSLGVERAHLARITSSTGEVREPPSSPNEVEGPAS